MGEERTNWQRVALANEEHGRVYIEIAPRGSRERVGLLPDSIPFDRITGLIASIAEGIGNVLEKAGPRKVRVELGLEFSMEAGGLVALITRGSAEANMKVDIEWERTP